MKIFVLQIKKLSFFLLIINLFCSNQIKSDEVQLKINEEKNKIVYKNSNFNQSYKSEYIIDSGDNLFIEFKGLKIFTNAYIVDQEGFLTLPEIMPFQVRGMTLQEIKSLLKEKYADLIYNPDFELTIKDYRTVNVVINGEVNNPGLYSLDYQSNNLSFSGKVNKTNQGPKLFDFIKIAQGVTNYADLSKIKVIRKNSYSQGGGKISAEIDLLKLLYEGEQTQNIQIFDGDYIIIPRTNNPIKDQVIAINRTNLNPENITIYVSGNVKVPGPKTLKKGATLNQAIASAGGNELFSGKVDFLRFNDDGSTMKKSFKFNKRAVNNSLTNPILMEGDIININKNIIGSTSKLINEISTPIFTGYGLYELFND